MPRASGAVESDALAVTTIALPSVGDDRPDVDHRSRPTSSRTAPTSWCQWRSAGSSSRPANPANPCWSTGSDPQICADYLIENERLLRYTGDGANFDWAVVRDVVPTIVGTVYTWAISPADIGSPANANAVFNSNGYAPNAYCGVGFACVSTGLPLPYE